MLALASAQKLFPSGFAHVPYVSMMNAETIRLRDNGAMQALRVEGVNAWTADDRTIDALCDGLASVLGQLTPEFTIYVHKIGKRLDPGAELPRIDGYGLARDVDRLWTDHLSKNG